MIAIPNNSTQSPLILHLFLAKAALHRNLNLWISPAHFLKRSLCAAISGSRYWEATKGDSYVSSNCLAFLKLACYLPAQWRMFSLPPGNEG